MKLDGRVAAVTGAGSGIGEAIARALAAEGARVAVLDVVADAASRVAGSLDGAHPVVVDVSDRAAVDAAVAEVEDRLGPLDVLVNNAGVGGRTHAERIRDRGEAQLGEAASGAITTALDSTIRLPDEEWREMIAVHLDGTFYCTRAALRAMAPRGRGAIINIASICGIEGCTGFPHYSAAKGGILGFTRAVAKEVILQGIRVNAIAPGFIDTPMADALSPMLRAATALATPQGRFGTPEEVAATAVFLASDDASFFVGETLSPNGGMVTT